MKSSESPYELRDGYVIVIDTVCHGITLAVSTGDGKIVVFETELEAQREIVDHQITRLQEFVDGERDFDDAMTVGETIVPVTLHPDGVLVDAEGNLLETSAD
ncbi:hypothetical protein [Haloferula sp.]|uniref:hypothetical protein n=1 Tax=Haloferula sp. TaxID=2497595 RepID=UPI003C707EC9